MAKKKIIKDEEITSLDTAWSGTTEEGLEYGYKKTRIEEFLKDQIRELKDDTARLRMSIIVTGGTVKSYVAGASSITFKYNINYTEGTTPIDFCRFRISVKGNIIFNDSVRANQENDSPELAEYLNNDPEPTTEVIMRAYDLDDEGNEKVFGTRIITYTKQLANVISQITLGQNVQTNDRLRHYVLFTGDEATLCARFYLSNGTILMNGDLDHWEYTLYNSGITDVITVPQGLTTGTHKIEVWLVLNDITKTESARTVSTVVTTAGAIDGTYFIVVGNIENAIVNDYVNIEYSASVYRSTSSGEQEFFPLLLQVLDNNKYVTKAIRTIGNGDLQYWNYLVKAETTSLRFIIPELNLDGSIKYSGDGSVIPRETANIAFSATRSIVSWTQETQGLLMYLTALNKSNSDYDIGTWQDSGYSVEFEDIQWNDNGSGWQDIPLDNEGNHITTSNRNATALHLVGLSKATIRDFYPLYDTTTFVEGRTGGGILATGRTLKMSFMVSNVSNPDEKIISCWDNTNRVGFYVTGESIYINFGGKELVSLPTESQHKAGHNERHFSSNKRLDLTIVIQPYYKNGSATNHEVKYYVNGEIAGMEVLDITTLTQSTPMPISFGGTGAVLDWFDFRAYNTDLDNFSVMLTRTMDLDNSVEINNTFNKNNFYEFINGEPKITLAKAIEYGKYLAKNGNTRFAVWVTTNLCNGEAYIGNTKSHSTKPENFYLFRFKLDANGNGIIDPDMTIFIESGGINEAEQEAFLRHRRQGTSTAKEAKGNIRIDVRNTCYIHKFNPDTLRFYERNDANIAAGYVYTVGKKAKIWLIPDSNAIPCYLLTCKKNPNESTQARNLPTARWYEDCCRFLAKNGYEDCLTMPQRRELDSIVAETGKSRTEAVDDIKTRQTVDGIPSLGFEIEYDSPAMLNPVVANTSFGGLFDMITDKTNMEVFGFGGYNTYVNEHEREFHKHGTNDEDFSIEWRRNDSTICNFLTADLSALNGIKNDNPFVADLEYRYPEWKLNGEDSSMVVAWSANSEWPATRGMEQSGPMQRLFDFIRTCAPDSTKNSGDVYVNGAVIQTGHIGQIPIYIKANEYYWEATINASTGEIIWTRTLYNEDTTIWKDDTYAARYSKFKTELGHYMVVNQVLFNGLAIDVALMVDQDTKNQFFTYFTGEVDSNNNKLLRLLGYDFDSSWDMDNDNFFRFDYTVKYSDGLYDGRAIYTYPGSLVTEGYGPELWKLVYACYKNEISSMKSLLYAGFLNKASILKYMHKDQVDIYNSLMYNANSEYSYTSKAADFLKTHGSAKEHTEWFVEGRMHYISGLNFSGASDGSSDFFKNAASFNLSTFNGEFISNYPKNAAYRKGLDKMWTLEITGYERTNAALAYGASTYYPSVAVNVTLQYDANYQPVGDPIRETAYLRASSDVGDASSDNRFRLFGGKHLKTVKGLDSWYIFEITDWGDLNNIEALEIGSTANLANEGEPVEYYRNPLLTSLNINLTTKPFGSCKKLNLAGCVALTEVNLLKFPVLEEFEGTRMDSITNVTLPIGKSLKKIHYPLNLLSIIIDNKPNLEEIKIDNANVTTTTGIANLTEITVTNSSDYAAQLALLLLGRLIA